jgi:6-phosphogluconate dehydrogenase
MDLGFVGLGRMGANMVKRLLQGGHRVVAYNRSPEPIRAVEREGATGAYTLEELVQRLTPPRAVWIMLPAGDATQSVIDRLIPLLSAGDTVIDGGNAYFKDAVRRAEALRSHGLHFLDVGTSGGIWGLQKGYCLMIGGPEGAFHRLEPVFRTLAPEGGYAHMGPHGAGHFVKMVHNGIEYGMLQAYGEGFDLLHAAPYEIDLERVARLWNQGSVVRSWLLELAEGAFAKEPDLASIRGYVEDSGEGRWTVQTAVELGVPAPVIAEALFRRFRSRQAEAFSDQFIAALRKEFGGHETRKT